MDGQYGTYEFTATEAANRDARSYGIFGGVEFIPRTGEVSRGWVSAGPSSLGYMRLDIDEPGVPDGSGITGEADISFEFLKKNDRRGYRFPGAFNSRSIPGPAIYLSTRYGAGIARRLSRRASLTYDFSYIEQRLSRRLGLRQA